MLPRIFAGLAVALLTTAIPVYAQSTLDSISSTVTDIGFGASSGGSAYGIYWGYVPGASHNICSVTVPLKAVGSPTDSVYLNMYIGSSTITFSSPFPGTSDTFFQSAVAQWQVRNTTYSDYTFTFSPCAVVVGANHYSFNLYRSGSTDNSNRYAIQGRDGSGAAATITGTATWVADRLLANSSFHANDFPTFAPSIELNGTENFGAIAPSTTPQFAQSVINTILGLNDDNATSTLTGAAGGWTNIPSYFAEKVPWGYLFDIADVYQSLSTTTSDFSEVAFDFSDTRISTGTRGWLPGRIVVFSTSTVTSYLPTSTMDALNTLAAAVGWITAIGYWFRRGMKT